jgi:NAD(P)-dependent dehydrogenase (short-subunit alcohol dehydrogenase family)
LTKAGVIELTKSMALELAPKVRVCAVAAMFQTHIERSPAVDPVVA